MRLYHDPASTVCRPIMLFLEEHEVGLELNAVHLSAGEHRSDWYGEVNPNRQVPTLVDGDFALTESATILRYLAQIVRSSTYPISLRKRAKVDETLDWFNTGFYRDFGYGIIYPQLFPEYRVHPAQAGELLTWHHQRIAARLQVLNDKIIADHEWVAGDFSIADYFGCAIVTLGETIGFDLSPWPNVERWIAAMKARPSWAPANAAFYGLRSALQAAPKAA